MQQVSDILLVRLRSLGDAILTLPLIEALHNWRPDLRQSVLIEAPFADVFRHHPAVHETIALPRGSGNPGRARLQAILEIRKHRFPAVINLHGGTTSMMFAVTSGARLRIGQESHRGSWLYSECVPPSTEIWGRQSLHTVEHQLSLLRWLDIPFSDAKSALYVSPSARSRISDRLAKTGLSEFLLIQPTATLRTKQWAPSNFSKLADLLSSNYRTPVIFTAAPHEKPVLDLIERTAQRRHTYWSDLSLIDLFALIEKCRLFVGCDSGPAHAAAALNKPVVAVWGSSNLKAWHPWNTAYEAVRSDLPCMPCPGYTCTAFGEPKCILDIPVSRVAEACDRMLRRLQSP